MTVGSRVGETVGPMVGPMVGATVGMTDGGCHKAHKQGSSDPRSYVQAYDTRCDNRVKGYLPGWALVTEPESAPAARPNNTGMQVRAICHALANLRAPCYSPVSAAVRVAASAGWSASP